MLHFQCNVVSVLSSRLPLQDMSHEQILSTEAVLECYAAECNQHHGCCSPEEIAGESMHHCCVVTLQVCVQTYHTVQISLCQALNLEERD